VFDVLFLSLLKPSNAQAILSFVPNRWKPSSRTTQMQELVRQLEVKPWPMFGRISSGWVSTRKHLKSGLELCDFTDCISRQPVTWWHITHTEGVEDICNTGLYLIMCGHIDINLGSVSAYCGVLFHHCTSHQCHHDSEHLRIQFSQSVMPTGQNSLRKGRMHIKKGSRIAQCV